MDNVPDIVAKRRQGRRGLRTAAALAVAGLVLTGAGIAYADDIYNTADATIDSDAEVMALNVGGVQRVLPRWPCGPPTATGRTDAT